MYGQAKACYGDAAGVTRKHRTCSISLLGALLLETSSVDVCCPAALLRRGSALHARRI